MADNILQLIPAHPDLLLVYRFPKDVEDEAKQWHAEPVVALALVRRGATQSVIPIEVSDGKPLLADDNPNYIGIYWSDDLPEWTPQE